MSKIVNENGVMRACLITPGQGTTGYYSPELLEKSVSRFDGAQVYWDHPTATEESIRPERSLRDLAGKIKPGTAKWESAGPSGAGIYADVDVFNPYREAVNEIGPHIGMSIRGSGTGKPGMIGGKPTTVIESLDAIHSVDFVTIAGRGGKPLQMFEAARAAGRAAKFNSNEGEVSDMDAAEVKKLQESHAASLALIEKLQKRALRADAMELAGAVLATTSLNEAQRKFVAESVVNAGDPPTKDGVLDAAKLTEAVNAFAKSYSATLPATGGVRGMGAGPALVQESAEVKAAREAAAKESQGKQVRALMELGLSEAAAKESVGVAA